MANIENSICEAIELIVDKTISEAGYNKTIQGIVQKCEDAAIGKYKIKYQDSTFYAYSTNPETTYHTGSLVYILIPNNNMNQNKTILGTVDKLGIEYIPTIESDEYYDIIGKNCILSNNQYKISSYAHNYIKTLYSYKNPENNLIQLDNEGLKKYLSEAKTLICSAYIQTKLPIEQQRQGNFGIIFGLDFKDNSTQKIVTRNYTIDIDNMTGNPYNLNLGKRQVGIFTIDGANFDKISSISLFVKDFPYSIPIEGIEEQNLFDIFISQLELMGAAPMSQEELTTCGISFYTPDGTIFTKMQEGMPDPSLRIFAKVKIKGKTIDTKTQKIPFYWFQEDASITNNNVYYNQIGGRGWKCLNQQNTITQQDMQINQVEWVPGDSEFIVQQRDVKAKELRFKCAIVYNENVYSKIFTITNFNSQIQIDIQSKMGTQFYYDTGTTDLTCSVSGYEEADKDKLQYEWGRIDSQNTFSTIENENKATLTNIAINTITDFVTYKCSVYNTSHILLGTGQIMLFNSLTTPTGYRLIINNGTQHFQYDEYGNSPTSHSLVKPQILQALTFTILDNLGRPLPEESLADCEVLWKIPTKNSLIKIDSDDLDKSNITEDFYFVTTPDLPYDIQNRYSYTYINNNILLEVKYKDTLLNATTNFTFVKMGDIGTNGTNFTCKIVPNNKQFLPNFIPILTTYKEEGYKIGHLNFNYGEKQSDIITDIYSDEAPFKVQLFESGELIFDQSESSYDVQVEWEFLRNRYDASNADQGYLNVIKDNFNLTNLKNNDTIKSGKVGSMIYQYSNIDNIGKLAHILKCTIKYKNMILFATLPINFITIEKQTDSLKIKENSGFQFVTYTSDGVSPCYNDIYPFEIEYFQNHQIQDLSKFLIQWKTVGTVYGYNDSNDSFQYVNSNNLFVQSKENIKNYQCIVKPADRYTGLCVTNAIVIHIQNLTGESIGTMHLPIHMALNKHGLAYLSDWDGNSIQLSTKGGFILSPQVGAGMKDKENAFTGILMGGVQTVNKKNVEIGLFGYAHGQQTIKLDALSGAALFGPSTGRLIIDPNEKDNKAMIYSAGYWKKYRDNGLPENYTESNINRPVPGSESLSTGALINFSATKNDAFIDFANGNFNLDASGNLVAKSGSFQGDIETTKNAYVGEKLYLNYDNASTNPTNASMIALGTLEDFKYGKANDITPRITFRDIAIKNVESPNFNKNINILTSVTGPHIEIDETAEGKHLKLESSTEDSTISIAYFLKDQSQSQLQKAHSIGLNRLNLILNSRQQINIDTPKLHITGSMLALNGDKKDSVVTVEGVGLTGTHIVTKNLQTINGLVVGVDVKEE